MAKTKKNELSDAEKWIQEEIALKGLDWRAGFIVKFKSNDFEWVLVDRSGKEVKYTIG